MVEQNEQLSFPEIQPPQPTEPSVDEIAAHIGKNARNVELLDRTSEAAKDQGWGPIEIPMRPETTPLLPRKHSVPPVVGPLRGDSELDTGQPGYHEPYVPEKLSETELSESRLGMNGVKAILNRDKTS